MLCDLVIFRRGGLKYSGRSFIEDKHKLPSRRVARKPELHSTPSYCQDLWLPTWADITATVLLFRRLFAVPLNLLKVPEAVEMSPEDCGAGLRYDNQTGQTAFDFCLKGSIPKCICFH